MKQHHFTLWLFAARKKECPGKLDYIFCKQPGGNHLEAQFKCAQYYAKGMGGVAKNKETALRWLRSAADRKHPDAMVMLANYHLKGKIKRDPDQALKLLATAVNAGSGRAATKMAFIYEAGLAGVPTDYEMARRCLEIAVQRKQAKAYVRLAEYYQHGLGGVSVDESKARLLFREGAAIKARQLQQQQQQGQQQQQQKQQHSTGPVSSDVDDCCVS